MNKVRKNTVRAKAWKLMRIMGRYTLTEIATLAEADAENIRHYHQCLVKAGYVRQVGTKKQEGRPGTDKIFRLIKNTGPKPPIQKDLRFIFDPNNGEYWAEDPEKMALIIVGAVQALPSERAQPAAPLPGITGKIDLKKPLHLLCPRKKKATPPHSSPCQGEEKGGVNVD